MLFCLNILCHHLDLILDDNWGFESECNPRSGTIPVEVLRIKSAALSRNDGVVSTKKRLVQMSALGI